MIACTQLSDRMPDVASGRARWTADEAHHLDTCADCGAEWEIVSAAVRLGAAAPSAGDPALTSRRVLERLAAARARGTRRVQVGSAVGIAVAAGIALAVWIGRSPGFGPGPHDAVVPVATAPAPSGVTPSPSPVPLPSRSMAELPLPELDSLPPEALDSMLRALDEPLARADAYDTPDFGDAGDGELEQALTGLEG